MEQSRRCFLPPRTSFLRGIELCPAASSQASASASLAQCSAADINKANGRFRVRQKQPVDIGRRIIDNPTT
jgi:hypothetical protein